MKVILRTRSLNFVERGGGGEEESTRSRVASKINRTRADRLSTCFNFPGYFAARGWGVPSLFHGKIDERIEGKDQL